MSLKNRGAVKYVDATSCQSPVAATSVWLGEGLDLVRVAEVFHGKNVERGERPCSGRERRSAVGHKRATPLLASSSSHKRHAGSSGGSTAQPPRMLLALSRTVLFSLSLFRGRQTLISGRPLGLRPRRQADKSTGTATALRPEIDQPWWRRQPSWGSPPQGIALKSHPLNTALHSR